MSENESAPDTYKILLDTKTVQSKMRSNKKGTFKDEERESALYNLVYGLSYQSNGDSAKGSKILDAATTLQTKFDTQFPTSKFKEIFERALKEGDAARNRINKIADKKIEENQKATEIIKEAMGAKNQMPTYIYEYLNEDGEPSGEYGIDYKLYSEHLHRELHTVNFKNNIYIYDNEMSIHRQQVNEIHTHARDTYIKYNVKGLLQSVVRETDAHIKSMGHCAEYPFVGAPGKLNVKNGIVDLITGELAEHDPNILFDYIISTPYKRFEKTEELDTFLLQYGNDEVVLVLAKALWQRGFIDTLKEFTVFFGDRDCGKTTAAELIQSTIDGDLNSKRNTSRTLLNDMLQRFGYAGMENKIINIGDDLPDMFVKNTGRINELVGSVHHDIEKKGIDRYHGIVTAYHLFTTNNLPPLDDDDMVIWSKIRLVEFKKQFSRGSVRENLYTELIKEQLLYRAIEKVRGWNTAPYKNNQSAEEVRRIWHEASSDVELFVADCIVYEPLQFVKLDEVKDHYEKWCRINNKRRHMKHLTKKLQTYLTRRAEGNGYMVKLGRIKEPERKDGEKINDYT